MTGQLVLDPAAFSREIAPRKAVKDNYPYVILTLDEIPMEMRESSRSTLLNFDEIRGLRVLWISWASASKTIILGGKGLAAEEAKKLMLASRGKVFGFLD